MADSADRGLTLTTIGASQKCDTSMGSIWAMEDFAVNSSIFHIFPLIDALLDGLMLMRSIL